MNRNQTKLLVENWRNLLHGNNNSCGIDFIESCNLEEGIGLNKETLLTALIGLSAFASGLDKVHAKKTDLRSNAKNAFEEMYDAFDNEEMNKAEKEEAYLQTLLDVLEDAGMPSKLRQKFEKTYTSGSNDTKAAIIVMCQNKVKSLNTQIERLPAKDPLVKKYQSIDFEKENASKQKNGKGKDEKGEYIIKNGKKYRLKSVKYSETTFRNQKMIDKMHGK